MQFKSDFDSIECADEKNIGVGRENEGKKKKCRFFSNFNLQTKTGEEIILILHHVVAATASVCAARAMKIDFVCSFCSISKHRIET